MINRRRRYKAKNSKENLLLNIVGIIGTLIVVITIYVLNAKESENLVDENYQIAVSKLEKRQEYVNVTTNDKVRDTVLLATSYILEAGHINNIVPDESNGMKNTTSSMANTLGIAILINHYNYDENLLEITKTSNNDIVEVLIVLVNEDLEKCYFIANYEISTSQLEIREYVGKIGATFG